MYLIISTPTSVVMDLPAMRRGLEVVMREEELRSRARFPFGKEAQLAFALHTVLCNGGLVFLLEISGIVGAFCITASFIIYNIQWVCTGCLRNKIQSVG